jgi:hypothetical protein
LFGDDAPESCKQYDASIKAQVTAVGAVSAADCGFYLLPDSSTTYCPTGCFETVAVAFSATFSAAQCEFRAEMAGMEKYLGGKKTAIKGDPALCLAATLATTCATDGNFAGNCSAVEALFGDGIGGAPAMCTPKTTQTNNAAICMMGVGASCISWVGAACAVATGTGTCALNAGKSGCDMTLGVGETGTDTTCTYMDARATNGVGDCDYTALTYSAVTDECETCWDHWQLYLVENGCRGIKEPAHGSVGSCSSSVAHGTECEFECDDHYELSEASTCMHGEFVGGVCERVQAVDPVVITVVTVVAAAAVTTSVGTSVAAAAVIPTPPAQGPSPGDPMSMIFAVQFVALYGQLAGDIDFTFRDFSKGFGMFNLQFAPPSFLQSSSGARRRLSENETEASKALGTEAMLKHLDISGQDFFIGNLFSVFILVTIVFSVILAVGAVLKPRGEKQRELAIQANASDPAVEVPPPYALPAPLDPRKVAIVLLIGLYGGLTQSSLVCITDPDAHMAARLLAIVVFVVYPVGFVIAVTCTLMAQKTPNRLLPCYSLQNTRHNTRHRSIDGDDGYDKPHTYYYYGTKIGFIPSGLDPTSMEFREQPKSKGWHKLLDQKGKV